MPFHINMIMPATATNNKNRVLVRKFHTALVGGNRARVDFQFSPLPFGRSIAAGGGRFVSDDARRRTPLPSSVASMVCAGGGKGGLRSEVYRGWSRQLRRRPGAARASRGRAGQSGAMDSNEREVRV